MRRDMLKPERRRKSIDTLTVRERRAQQTLGLHYVDNQGKQQACSTHGTVGMLLPSDCMLSLPEMLRPVNAGMQDADTGLCTVLSGRLTGMLPTEARKALMLKDILFFTSPLSFSPPLWAPGQLCAAYGLEMRAVTKWLPLWASFKAASRQKECGTLISLCAGTSVRYICKRHYVITSCAVSSANPCVGTTLHRRMNKSLRQSLRALIMLY